MLGCCFLVSEYAKEYKRRKREEELATEKRSFEMRERVLVYGGDWCATKSEEREGLLNAREFRTNKSEHCANSIKTQTS
jgi:hypothetical protein